MAVNYYKIIGLVFAFVFSVGYLALVAWMIYRGLAIPASIMGIGGVFVIVGKLIQGRK